MPDSTQTMPQVNGQHFYQDPSTKIYGQIALTINGDLVLYGGYIYKAVTFNTGLKPSQYTTDWNVTFEGYKFRGDWNNLGSEDSASNIDYKTGDFVRLSGSLYIAIQDSTNLQPGEWSIHWEKVIDGRQFRDSIRRNRVLLR